MCNPSGSRGQYLKIDSPLQSNKLLNPLVRQLRLTLHFDYNQFLSFAVRQTLRFCPNVQMLDSVDCERPYKVKILVNDSSY